MDIELTNTEHWCLSELSDRGWTPKLIEEHLGDPDHIKANPYYRRAAPMRLYNACRVTAAEQTSEVAAHLAKTLKRRRTKAARLEDAFLAKYPDGWRDALSDACEAMFKLNHFAKTISFFARKAIYSIEQSHEIIFGQRVLHGLLCSRDAWE